MSYISIVLNITFGLQNFEIGNLNIGLILVEKNTAENFRKKIGSNFLPIFDEVFGW